MTEGEIIEECTCKKCGWTWLPRSPDPKMCPNPKCRSPYWDEDRDEDGKLIRGKNES